MIFDNRITSGTALTSSIWNKAWGFDGTAKTLYDDVGAQQYTNQIYSNFSWANGKQIVQSAIANEFIVVEHSFTTGTYDTSNRSGDLTTWQTGMVTDDYLRDGIYIPRDGYYYVQCDVNVNDSANRIGNTLNVDGISPGPNNMLSLRLIKASQADSSTIVSVEYLSTKLSNVIVAATGNSPEYVQPHYSITANKIIALRKATKIIIQVSLNNYPGRNQKIISSHFKAYLLKSITPVYGGELFYE